MTTTITATSGSDQVTAFHFSQYVFVQRSFLFGTVSIIPGSDQNDADASEPYNGIVEGFNSSAAALSLFNQLSSEMLDIAARFPPLNSPFGQGIVTDYFELFNDTAVDYSNSNLKIFVDMEIPVQHGGFAEGDVLTDVFEVTGSAFDDVIRGSNTSDYPPDSTPRLVNGTVSDLRLFFTLHNPGDNVLNGGGGDDVLEGRGGADVLNGGSGLNYASYESSPAAVTVRLAGVVSDPQTFLATGGDAAGDTFSAIQGLLGSGFDDSLTGNSQNNVLAGGLGSDTLDGKGGTDTVDYSHDHFSDIGTTADKVVVHLGPNGTSGTGAEFDAHVDIHTLTVTFTQVSTDTLISIENVIGTNGPDEIIGNEQANTLDGRQGNDTLDGGLGNDTLIGGPGIDTVSYVSHDNVPLLLGEANNIKLGLNGAAGSYTRSGIVSVVPLQFQTVETDVLNGIENVTGSNHSETIIGNEQANTLDGRQGNDTLNGGLGNDTLKGGTVTIPTTSEVAQTSAATLFLTAPDSIPSSLTVSMT
jgi:Ca2+-binding RTX toxin-like protein